MSKTTSNSQLESVFIERFDELDASMNGKASSHIHAKRREAIKGFEKIGLPGSRNESYKYTNVLKGFSSRLVDANFKPVQHIDSDKVESFIHKNLDAHILVFINGIYSAEHSRMDSIPEKVEVMPLSQAIESRRELVEKYFSAGVDPDQDAYASINTAFSLEGTFIRAPKSTTVDKPIIIYHITDASEESVVVQPRNLFLIEENAELSVVESYKSIGQANFTNAVTEIFVGKNARVSHAKLEIELENAVHVGTTQVSQEEGSTFTDVTATFGGDLVRNNLNIDLNGERCEANMFGLFVLNEKQHVDNNTSVDHKEPNCESNELYKGVLDDSSRGVFNGKIYVRQDAQKTNAFQSNNNILLSDSAVIDTKPQLEIWADDVKCSHGATTGQLDDNQLFYLRARGIDKDKARAILLFAFAMEVIEKIRIEPLREYLDSKLSERLSKEF